MYMKDLWHTFLKKDHANFTGFSQGEKRKPFFKKKLAVICGKLKKIKQ
jgi:hypothetical protein